MKERKIDELGRIVLPVEMRQALCLVCGDAMTVELGNGRLILTPCKK